jgi:anti-anti-sigma regulatory factor
VVERLRDLSAQAEDYFEAVLPLVDSKSRRVAIRKYPVGAWTVLEAAGQIGWDASHTLSEMLNGEPPTQLVFDLRNATFVDETGQEIVASLWDRVTRAGGSVRLVGRTDWALEFLRNSPLGRHVEIFVSLDEATDSYDAIRRSGQA